MRRKAEMEAISAELSDKLWWYRNFSTGRDGGAAAKEIEDRYGRDELLRFVHDPYLLGFLEGQLSMVRWCIGWDEGLLDS